MSDTLKAPEHLSAESRKLWTSILQDFDIDLPATLILQATLEARDQAEAARLTLEAEGTIQTDRFGQRKSHPAIAIQRDAVLTMQRGFRLLGFDQEQRAGRKG